MDVFSIRKKIITAYSEYAQSFIQIQDARIRSHVEERMSEGEFWPDPLIQLNPRFESGDTVRQAIDDGLLHEKCAEIFEHDKDQGGRTLRFHRHQRRAIEIAKSGHNYVLTTGTGSGKSLAYIAPIVDHVLQQGSGQGIQAIVVYPMNALVNSQEEELGKFLKEGFAKGEQPVTFERYTGQVSDEERERIINDPPDILLTNYVMLELIMTRPVERRLIEKARGLRFVVLDELHTYRGRQGADVALLMRRVRERLEVAGQTIQFVGTSATMASGGSFEKQRQQVAQVSSDVFGARVLPEHVIGETLQRATPGELDTEALSAAVAAGDALVIPADYAVLVAHPLSIWIENTFGLRAVGARLQRQTPRSIESAAEALSELTAVDTATCEAVIQRWLLAGYEFDDPTTGLKPFAFRLHQFISPGDTAYATLESENERHITLSGQRYFGADRKLLFPLCFCRECGQEYYTVSRVEGEDGETAYVPRDFRERHADIEGEGGYLYLSEADPWPYELDAVLACLPQDWLEEGPSGPRVRRDRRKYLPQQLQLDTKGRPAEDGQRAVFLPMPFMFCLSCGVSYTPRQRSDFVKLGTLNSEGRSSATTILSLAAVRALKDSALEPMARKLLSFTDNRQDASLQAGHFNDFVEVSLLRGAIYRAVSRAGEDGLRAEEIPQAVFSALNLPFIDYSSEPKARFQTRRETERTLQEVLAYRVYRDLRRGWRISLPNLEQCGLLRVDYESLDEVCAAEDVWAGFHPTLVGATPATRVKIARVLLDFMRRELAIKAQYLDRDRLDRIKDRSFNLLKAPWALDEDEKLEPGTIALARSRRADEWRAGFTYISALGLFGQYLRRTGIFAEYSERLDTEATWQLIRELLLALQIGGIVEEVLPARGADDVPGYQLNAAAMRWCVGDGRSTNEPLRMPNAPSEGGRPNPFFREFYQAAVASLRGFQALEHTAQVPNDQREEREEQFRSGDLPILYCSPTMELGVDIAQLNVVNMRNVPPTPANYAQRSGRAGRSGQPALVFTYCSSGSPHDKYFFARPELMVSGSVAPPRLDLNNRDLLKAHIHAVWLAEVGLDLRQSLTDLLDMSGDPPELPLTPAVQEEIARPNAQLRTRQHVASILRTIPQLEDADALLDHTMQNVKLAFDSACNRWRGLYQAARNQAQQQNRILLDHSRSAVDKRRAKRQHGEALAQLRLLTDIENLVQSDFYSYRYFATEGFLPGYSFPRLPLSAYIPGRRQKQADSFLSRPRFLAIAEFGPRALIYHEGSRYEINQVMMPVSENEDGPLTTGIKRCDHCGYMQTDVDFDVCESCRQPLGLTLRSMLKMQNVKTRRRDRINADEEERVRLGYELKTGLRFSNAEDQPDMRTANVELDGEDIARLIYAQTATIWRINLGWRRRRHKEQLGFVLEIENGLWARRETEAEDDQEDPLSPRTQRVIPFVEDSRNCLLLQPLLDADAGQMASLQAALKRAIEREYQLEDNELAAEPLPDVDNRQQLLFYEAAEGGAGVLSQLVEDPEALRNVARVALEICHFDAEGVDLGQAEGAIEPCEAACYDCLLSYGNQREHDILDRKTIVEWLLRLAGAVVKRTVGGGSPDERLTQLLAQCESDLERKWLQQVAAAGMRLPDQAQHYIAACETRPDFIYERNGIYVAVYIDGPHHDYPERQARDRDHTERMENEGYSVIRFGYLEDWDAKLSKHRFVFGGEA